MGVKLMNLVLSGTFVTEDIDLHGI